MQRYPVVFLLFILLYAPFAHSSGIQDSTTINKQRLSLVLAGTGAAYGFSLLALNEAWYKKQRSSFHFFNDNAQWNQIDKIGHTFSAYQLSRFGRELFLWTNMNETKATIWGGVLSQAFMIPIEVFDGYSSEYGFSWGDITANLLGTGLFVSQELILKEQKVKLKLSFHPTDYASLRPELLGSGYFEEILKDYNGQTYWLSFDLYALANENSRIPKWINLALGYGAEEMVYAREPQNNANGFSSNRQYFVGIDFDFSHIKSEKSLIKSLLFVADMIKFPAPALEFTNNKKINYHWLYY